MTRDELLEALELADSDDYTLSQALLLSAEDVRLEIKRKDDERQLRLEEKIYKEKMEREGRCCLCKTILTMSKNNRMYCKECMSDPDTRRFAMK